MSMRSVLRQSPAVRSLLRSSRSAAAVQSSLRVPSVGAARNSMRTFTSSVQRAEEHESPFGVNSLAKFNEEEEMLRETVRRFAENEVKPRVEAMDENEKMDPEIIKGLFEQGLMAIETDPELGGAGCSFMSAIIVIEELAKVDPSVSVLCDVHNVRLAINTDSGQHFAAQVRQRPAQAEVHA